ncbi:site-specific DNA-methyltransferase [Hymenobacter nivis]|uniref:Site-specific DNA-methyltransferase n=1 Tax=Hymenobacter nivis TaxID=1850093 RepID=A0A2Z3GYA8_9BACT|nr:site-specific DNA-methyltransferase [Hymenobacter nivis]AWM33740.1 site-specific DNA-methyltransferase [Hymenobacter nivis]
MNELILGDNLEVLRHLPAESVDLIYLDPPFFSNRTYEVIWGDAGERRSFEDRWSGGIMQYIDWLNERVRELHRVLKPTGSLFLHCDWHADAYIRVFILDKIFGEENFRAEIAWKRSGAHNDAKQGRKALGNIVDKIFYYSKSGKYNFNQLYTEYDESYVEEMYRFKDPDGRRYRVGDLTAAKGGGNTSYEWKGVKPYKGRYWAYSIENMEKFDADGLLVYSKTGMPQFKRYLDTMPGVPLQNEWSDITALGAGSKERIGYPTQKPVALLERIIAMASHEGDVVLDPFVGGGTTVVAAERLKRRWLGIDQSVQAVKVTELRLLQGRDLFSSDFAVRLHKYDVEALKAQNPYAFEGWLVTQFGGTPNVKRRGDLGLDGTSREGLPLQVKQSEGIGRNVVDNFRAAAERHDAALFARQRAAGAPVGYILAFSFGKGAVEECARLRTKEGIGIELVAVKDIVPLAHKPRLAVAVAALEGPAGAAGAGGKRAVRLTATGESPAGIEFYAWDAHHDPAQGFRPSILLDKTGVQTFQLRPGAHVLAVQVVDNDGLSATEVVRLHVNGEVKRG